MGLCNEVAARWQADRVGIGFLKGRYVHLKAMSHTEKFSRKMKIVQDIESAMEECLDQDIEVLYPTPEGATFVSRAAGELSSRHGPTNIVAMPMRRDGEAVAVLLVERPADRPFLVEEIEALRLTCELITGSLVSLHEHDRWIGAKVAQGTRKLAAGAVGSKHTWVKLIAIGVCGFILFAVLAKGKYQAEAPFVIEPVGKQMIQAPFDGQLEEVFVEPGVRVEAGALLATMRTDDLQNQLSRSRAQLEEYKKMSAKAFAEGKYNESAQADANQHKVQEEIDIYERRMRNSKIISPVSGYVLRGDLKREAKKPVQTGDMLFEVAPLESLRAELAVPEDQIVDVAESGQTGELASKSFPGQRIAFTVERVNPVAEVVDNENVFKVRVVFDQEVPVWMRPGMEGVGKIDIDRRSYAWLWTHRLVNWVRMKLWV
jgi:biotin carboxyl carrier protein